MAGELALKVMQASWVQEEVLGARPGLVILLLDYFQDGSADPAHRRSQFWRPLELRSKDPLIWKGWAMGEAWSPQTIVQWFSTWR